MIVKSIYQTGNNNKVRQKKVCKYYTTQFGSSCSEREKLYQARKYTAVRFVSLSYRIFVIMMILTKVPVIAICGKLSTEKIPSQSNTSPWWAECSESRRSVTRDKENKIKHPTGHAILKPKMTSPPWLRACWMTLCPNWFKRKCASLFDASKAEPVSYDRLQIVPGIQNDVDNK